MSKVYRLIASDGSTYESAVPGRLGGNSQARIYGLLSCGAARQALGRGYESIRVFFADEDAAIAAGYRPCGTCMRVRYRQWAGGPQAESAYPWRISPPPDVETADS